MERQLQHAVLPVSNAEERARQDFVQSFKLHLAAQVVPEIQRVYDERKAPEFRRRHERAPKDRFEVESLMGDDYVYRMWGSLYRTAQEMLWTSVAEAIARQREDLAARARVADPLGSLSLDPALPTPRYVSAVDIHCMPGGYHGEAFDGDVSAGALYDRGVHVFGMGGLGPRTDMMGRLVATYLRETFPDLAQRDPDAPLGEPLRILDLGCSVGHSLLPYAEVFPGARLHGVDVAAPVLRYGHARAEALGVEVHFHQMNAESLAFPDDSFDLVVSHILLHETSAKAIRRVLRESHRVVRAGGVVAHVDMDGDEAMTPFNSFMMMYDGVNNNEPFWPTFRRMDPAALLAEAGFAPDKLFLKQISRAYPGQAVFKAGKADGGRGHWRVIGGRK